MWSGKIDIHVNSDVKTKMRKFILIANYTIAVIICLTLLAQTQIPIVERALFGFGTIFVGMGIRRVVETVMPVDGDNQDKT
tara:strand:+ start:885 stop:1127 length:243 start_codon:yes stop_codon:yes gene_type:complete